MSARERVEAARRALVATVLVTASARAAAATLAGLLALGLADLAAPLPLGIRTAALPAALAAGLLVLGILTARGRRVFRLGNVALYLEERTPALEYALVTALEVTGPGAEFLERAVARTAAHGSLRAPVSRSLATSFALLVVVFGGLAALPTSVRLRILRPAPGDALLASRSAPAGNRISRIAVRVIPPSYARQSERRLDDPAGVSGLVGSRIEIVGRGAALGELDSLGALLGTDPLRITTAGDTWTVAMPMPPKPAAVRLRDRAHARLLALEPIGDQPPVVNLTAPARDTTYLLPRGRLELAGTARDDIGLVRVEFELMHTTGSGERFDIRRITLGGIAPGGAASASVHAALLLDTMRLGPGDVLHVRVVATDGNDVSGPGEDASDTRTIRIADPRARDTIQVIPAALAALDTTMLSQRMLVIRAETLVVQRRRISPVSFNDRSRMLGQQQGLLRERVEAVIEELTTATDVGFTGETEASRILAEAAAAMKLAQRELTLFRPRDALPYMYRALRALERLRNGERLYLRGVFPKLVVDLDKIRLKGTDRPSVGPRGSRPAEMDARRGIVERLNRALTLVAREDPAARDSLVSIRVDALTRAPDAAPALARAIEALRAGRDANTLIGAARRVLLRATEGAPGISLWRGAP
ncbi:MAG TPA: hypothetical protein VFU23_11040 [Gemmatimonadales bacterium]|nr:hypothetical protein [Gemmatimonadales bacterium]